MNEHYAVAYRDFEEWQKENYAVAYNDFKEWKAAQNAANFTKKMLNVMQMNGMTVEAEDIDRIYETMFYAELNK